MDPIPLPRVPLGAPRATADSTMPLSAMPHSAVELEPLERAVERAVEPRERIAHAPRERTQEEVAPPPPPPPPPHPTPRRSRARLSVAAASWPSARTSALAARSVCSSWPRRRERTRSEADGGADLWKREDGEV